MREGNAMNKTMDKNQEAAFLKLELLKNNIRKLGRVGVAYSGGVDSTFLLKVAHDVLGENAIAVTANTSSFTEEELLETMAFCKQHAIHQKVVNIDLLCIPAFANNAPDRCYHCKKHIFNQVLAYGKEHSIAYILEGSNMDDDGDYRPGHRAIAELHINSPLRQAGLTKAEIRFLSKEMGIYTWNKPSFACLASRFVYGDTITEEKLDMVKMAERYLARLGLKQYRVRVHDTLARIEILPEDFSVVLAPDVRKELTDLFRELGFSYTTLDVAGYRTGSMNAVLNA